MSRKICADCLAEYFGLRPFPCYIGVNLDEKLGPNPYTLPFYGILSKRGGSNLETY